MSDPRQSALTDALKALTVQPTPTTAQQILILGKLFDSGASDSYARGYVAGELEGIRQGGEAAIRGIDAAAAELEHADEPSELEQHGDWELVTQ